MIRHCKGHCPVIARREAPKQPIDLTTSIWYLPRVWIPTNEHIKHVLSTREALLSESLGQLLDIPQEKALSLIHLGAIYVEKSRVIADAPIKGGTYLRVHLYPKRYPTDSVDWAKATLAETEDFVVVDKPAGIPVPPSVDNALENVVFQMSRTLGKDVYVTHRIDRPTRGLLVLAKTKKFQSQFNKLLVDRQVHKKYLARTEKKIEPGTYVHYMENTLTAPKVLVTEEKPNRLRCELRIEEVAEENGTYLHKIDLLTGRTHQIRAQLAFMGAPILGDKPYGGVERDSYFENKIALTANELRFLNYSYVL